MTYMCAGPKPVAYNVPYHAYHMYHDIYVCAGPKPVAYTVPYTYHMCRDMCVCAGPKPVLRVVSFHADDTNRSPTFDMDLTELLRDGQPISYSEARTYFKSDPATRSLILLALLASMSHLMHDDASPCICAICIPELQL